MLVQNQMVNFIIGGFYPSLSNTEIAFYNCDENGKIKSQTPVIIEFDYENYENLFKEKGYTLI
jgi:hypothetical protein